MKTLTKATLILLLAGMSQASADDKYGNFDSLFKDGSKINSAGSQASQQEVARKQVDENKEAAKRINNEVSLFLTKHYKRGIGSNILPEFIQVTEVRKGQKSIDVSTVSENGKGSIDVEAIYYSANVAFRQNDDKYACKLVVVETKDEILHEEFKSEYGILERSEVYLSRNGITVDPLQSECRMMKE